VSLNDPLLFSREAVGKHGAVVTCYESETPRAAWLGGNLEGEGQAGWQGMVSREGSGVT
jgi:hypothetical protein